MRKLAAKMNEMDQIIEQYLDEISINQSSCGASFVLKTFDLKLAKLAVVELIGAKH
jgi:hypothetical protein